MKTHTHTHTLNNHTPKKNSKRVRKYNKIWRLIQSAARIDCDTGLHHVTFLSDTAGNSFEARIQNTALCEQPGFSLDASVTYLQSRE